MRRRRYSSRATRFSARVLEQFASANLPETLTVKAAAGDAPAELLIYDEIGYFGINAQDVSNALKQLGDGRLRVRINSPGGDAFDGFAIYNLLKTRGNVETMIDGLAASAASYIAMAGDTVSIAEHAFVMIHDAWGLVIGNAQDMLETAALLEKIDGEIAAIYAQKSGKPVEDFKTAMDNETWYTSQEAKAAGLVSEIILPPADQQQNRAPGARASLRNAARPGIQVADADWKCGAATDLPIDTSDSWDGAAAAERVLDDAGFNGDSPDPAKARRAFLAYDAADPKLKGSYKLPFADLVGGELKAVKGGVDNAASRLPQTDIPSDVAKAAEEVLDAYQKKMGEQDDDGDQNKLASAAAESDRARRLRLAEATA